MKKPPGMAGQQYRRLTVLSNANAAGAQQPAPAG